MPTWSMYKVVMKDDSIYMSMSIKFFQMLQNSMMKILETSIIFKVSSYLKSLPNMKLVPWLKEQLKVSNSDIKLFSNLD